MRPALCRMNPQIVCNFCDKLVLFARAEAVFRKPILKTSMAGAGRHHEKVCKNLKVRRHAKYISRGKGTT